MEDKKFIEENSMSIQGVDVLCWKDENPETAVINFSSMNPGKFERWSWFKSKPLSKPAVYIFMKDEGQNFYLGHKNNPLCDKLSDFLLDKLSLNNVPLSSAAAVGASMGGYASIYFALKMGLKFSISINPQVDYESACLHKFGLWKRKILESAWVDLDSYIEDKSNEIKKSHIELCHGLYPADLSASNKLENALISRGVSYSKHQEASAEHGWLYYNSETLIDKINSLFYG
ncbi:MULTISPECIES: alpha/beta hydrolase-fold protein [Pseudomonas]|uniref:alpha/beta hydrolase-fold protein n=1 Tax=Pseudomonas TaxID=286 RepID=UPI00289AB73D|nr:MULTISPECIES: alpha/beta hydrolase-fold protein [Pseudomonas]